MAVENIVAITGTYTNKNGEEKKQYTTVGKLITKENGQQSIKMDCIPLGRDGRASIYAIEPKKEKPAELPADDLPF